MFELKLHRKVPGRFIKNVRGTLVLFHDGVAVVDATVAEKAALDRKITVTPLDEEAVVEDVVMEEVVAEEATDEVESSEVEEASESAEEESTSDEEPAAEEETSEEVEEEEEGEDVEASSEYTKEQIEGLYESLGTWTAVAESLGVNVTILRGIRKDVGLL